MPKHKRKFIDKKHATTFSLVHRSEQDPHLEKDPSEVVLLSSARKEEQLKYGIEFDDEYDYLQHLRDVNELYNVQAGVFRVGTTSSEVLMTADSAKKCNLILPSCEKITVGISSKAASATDYVNGEADCVTKALELEDVNEGGNDDFEDDFIVQLNGGSPMKGEIDHGESDDMGSMDEFFEEEGKNKGKGVVTKFTIGSIFASKEEKDEFVEDKESGACINRPFVVGSIDIPEGRKGTHLEDIDKKFAELYQQYIDDDYDDADEVPSDVDEDLNEHVSKHMIEQFTESNADDLNFDLKIDDDLKGKILETVENDNHEEEKVKITVEVPVRKWDCESILSLRSNTSHLPKTIHLPKKPKVVTFSNPIEKVAEKKPQEVEEQTPEEPKNPGPRHTLVRGRDETKEERKARKDAAKAEKKMRREEKKETKRFFRDERDRMARQQINQTGNFQGSSIL